MFGGRKQERYMPSKSLEDKTKEIIAHKGKRKNRNQNKKV